MTFKSIIVVFTATVWLSTQPSSSAEEPSEKIWVCIDATIKGLGMPTVEYYGALDRKVFEETLTRTMPSGFLKLTHVGWMEGGKMHWIAEVTQDGNPMGFSDVLYLRVETVTRIVELDKNFVKQHVLQTK